MSTINAILTPSPDGTLHIPLPAGWSNHAIKVTATLEIVQAESDTAPPMAPRPGSLKGFKMASDFDEPLEALERLRTGFHLGGGRPLTRKEARIKALEELAAEGQRLNLGE